MVEGRRVPGLGEPNVDEACSVWALDLSAPATPRVTARIRTGLPMGQSIGGSSPAGLAVSADTLYVANSNNDTVEAYDFASQKRRWATLLAPAPYLAHLRGVLPFGLALSADGRRLFVAESGLNAVGVLDAATGAVRATFPPRGIRPSSRCPRSGHDPLRHQREGLRLRSQRRPHLPPRPASG